MKTQHLMQQTPEATSTRNSTTGTATYDMNLNRSKNAIIIFMFV